MIPKSLREKRDARAENLLVKDASQGLRHCYRIGYDQGVADHAELTQKLVTALEVYAMTNETFPEYGEVAREVLAAYRKAMETGGK